MENKQSVSRRANWLAGALVAVGLLQSFGFLLGMPSLRRVGALVVASPLPLVFSHFQGLETFSSTFEVVLTLRDGRVVREALDPVSYGKLGGPYNRRNVYGAVAAYGPALQEPAQKRMVENVLRYALCGGPLVQKLGISEPIEKGAIRVRNERSAPPLDALLEVTCEGEKR